jgi:hypothetical protein
MAATMSIYGTFPENLMLGNFGDLSDAGTTIKCALMKDTFVFDADDDNWGEISGDECVDEDYTDEGGEDAGLGGQEIENKVVDYDSATDTVTFETTDSSLSFTSEGTIAASYAVIYMEAVADADSKLIACLDFGGEEASSDGKFEIVWHADGILQASVNPA